MKIVNANERRGGSEAEESASTAKAERKKEARAYRDVGDALTANGIVSL